MADPRFFRNHGPFSLGELAVESFSELANPGQSDLSISDVAPLQAATDGMLTFLTNPKYKDQLKDTKASACILHPDYAELAPDGVALLLSPLPYKAYALIAQAFYPLAPENPKIHSTAAIGEGVELGEGVTIGANTVIGDNVVIGDRTQIGANVTISHALIGSDVRIFPGVCIGQDGFGFAPDPKGHVTVPQLGRVIIEDKVEIGANCCIDRGAGPDTVIGEGTRLDNLVQVGHNVKIGKHCIIIAQVGMAGSTDVGDYAVLAAQSGIGGHLTIGAGAQIGAKSGVANSVKPGEKVMGMPAKPVKDFWREQVLLNRMVSDYKNNRKKSDGQN